MEAPPRRTRAAVIVEQPGGILLTAIRGQDWLLPGGGVEAGEDEEQAARRELLEETGLVAGRCVFLCAIETLRYRHVAFWAAASGTPQPASEIDALACYQPGMRGVAPITRALIDRFLRERERDPGRFR